MFGKVKALVQKEFLAVWQDKKSRTILIVPPLVQLFLFSFAATLDVENIRLGVYNIDSGKYGFELVQRFIGARVFRHVEFYKSEAEMKEAVTNTLVPMALHIDEEFSRKLLEGRPAPLQLIFDGRKSNSAQIVYGYATQIVEQFNHDIGKSLLWPQPETILIPRNWFNPNLIYIWFTVPGLSGILIMLMALLITALSVAREREIGTFEQLLVSPLLQTDILLGKMLPGVIIGLIEGAIILFAAIFVFEVPFRGSFIYLFFSMAVFVSSVVGIGLFISSISRTQQQAILGVFSFMVPAVALSGFATPIENMPDWLQTFTLANPLRFYLVVVRGVFLKEIPFDVVWNQTYPMALIAIVNLSLASWYFRRKLG